MKTFWFRLACLVVGAGAVYVVFRRIQLQELARALRSADLFWLVMAVLAYGLGFLPAAARWHLALDSTACAVDRGVTRRMTLIGHFFYTIFFGVAGGDFAKSALYARWYRLALPEVLAAAPLDRLLGFGGLAVFVALAFGLAGAKGGFTNLAPASWRLPVGWVLLILTGCTLVALALARGAKDSAPGRMLRAFGNGSRRLLSSGPLAGRGLVCGFLVQAAFAANLALSLQAVSRAELPWGQLAWTFPVIATISAVPFTIAGLGFREGAAMALLGLYGVSPAEAVAASLLTLVARLVWAAAGGWLLWIEQRKRRRFGPAGLVAQQNGQVARSTHS